MRFDEVGSLTYSYDVRVEGSGLLDDDVVACELAEGGERKDFFPLGKVGGVDSG